MDHTDRDRSADPDAAASAPTESTESTERTGASRRQFLKGAVVGGAVASQTGCAESDSKIMKLRQATRTTTVCPFCGVGCGQVAFSDGDRLMHTEGDPEHPISEGTLCSKGASISQISNNPRRLRDVLYRAPGATEFVKKSWEWTFERIAQRVKETRDATFTRSVDGTPVNRTEAIACLGGAALDNEECYAIVKLMRALGLTYIEHQARI
jgi:formate dehydrogenase major subunit